MLEQLWAYVQFPLLAGMVGLAWGLSEIVGKFELETGRALRTSGAWLLLTVNFLAALVCQIIVATLVPGAANWAAAILVGLAWPTVIRNLSFKLGQPLDNDAVQQQAAVRVEEAYAQVQQLAQRMINQAVTRQRLRQMNDLLALKLEVLAQYAHRALIASPLQEDDKMPKDQYIDVIVKGDADEDTKKALLVATLMNYFGRDLLDDLVKERRSGGLA